MTELDTCLPILDHMKIWSRQGCQISRRFEKSHYYCTYEIKYGENKQSDTFLVV